MFISLQIVHSPITQATAIMRTFTAAFVVFFLAGTVLAFPGVDELIKVPDISIPVTPDCKDKPCEVKCPDNSSWGAGNFCTDACKVDPEICTKVLRCGCFCNKKYKRSTITNKCVPEKECCAEKITLK